MYAIENSHIDIIDFLESIGGLRESRKSKMFRTRVRLIAKNVSEDMFKRVEVSNLIQFQ